MMRVTTISFVLLTTVYHVLSSPIKDKITIVSNQYDVNYVHSKRSINNTVDYEKSLNYIDKTVKEVQAILNSNTTLPRLTRGEILEIIENITKADLAAAQKQKNGDRTQKAVMLVMPYTPNNDDDGKMQELYTKPPVTQIIDSAGSTKTKPTQKPQPKEGTFRGEVFVEPLPKVPKSQDTNQRLNTVKEEPFIGASTAEVRPDSYVQFKPLPDLGDTNEEMEEFLGRFGLGKSSNSNRKQKQYVQDPKNVLNEVPEIEFEMLPDDLRDTVKDLGFTSRIGKKVRNEETLNGVSKPSDFVKPKRQHVFNPVETPYATQDDIDKLNQLMDIIKQLEMLNATAHDDTLNQIDVDNINQLVGSLNRSSLESLDKQKSGPNPVSFDEGLAKNEIKRQENSTTTITTSATLVTTTAVTTTSEEAETPNIKDLEDSFGGSANAEPEVIVTLPPPTEAPKTGFYYLLDWNSFLDIDDQKGKRVNLRFQPKAGNPQDFIAVSIP